MRKTILGVFTTVMLLSVGSTTAFAAGHGTGHHQFAVIGDNICHNVNNICNYIDKNSDGICDNYTEFHQSRMENVICNFVDADGDGICDNYTTGQAGGNGQGYGAQDGRGSNFTDTDGDGVCDNYATGQAGGNGHGRGQGNGTGQGQGNGFRGGHCR